MKSKKWYVYMVECCDGTLYTGITTDLDRRVDEHNNSTKGAKYTASRRPVKLVYFMDQPNRSSACITEAKFKKMKRAQKDIIIKLSKSVPR